MAEQGTIKPGDTVTHEWWGEGVTAKVIGVHPMQVRARYSKSGRPMRPLAEHMENTVQLDRAISGSYPEEHVVNGVTKTVTIPVDPDDHWMECGLFVVQPVAGEG